MKQFAILIASAALLSWGLFATAEHPLAKTDDTQAESADRAAAADPRDAPLIVHEWGTFTSFSGSDGVNLEYRPLLENDLPSFVIDITDFGRIFTKSRVHALQRMETPVTYFYTPIERDVSVSVRFPQGLLTEYYPPVRQSVPDRDSVPKMFNGQWPTSGDAEPQHPELKDSVLDWGRLHLIPTASLNAHVEDEELSHRIGKHVERTMVPGAGGYIHYSAARETDSAIVQFRQQPVGTAGGRMTPGSMDYFEKFLFYRGVGNFELPLTLTENSDGHFELANDGSDEVRSLFLVTVEGESLRFRRYDGVGAGDQLTLRQSSQPSDIDQLAEAMVTSLINEGLYEKEARAMIKCWRSSWFGEEGTRLLYMVPADITNELLPLHVEPTPDKTVRVLVGRMEIMPASREQQVLELVQQSAAARSSASGEEDQSFQSPSLEPLLAMGRLAEPALVRARHITTDAELQAEATQLVHELRSAAN